MKLEVAWNIVFLPGAEDPTNILLSKRLLERIHFLIDWGNTVICVQAWKACLKLHFEDHDNLNSWDFKPPKDLFYQMTLKRIIDDVQNVGKYEPEVGDLIVFTDIRPRSIDDLNRPKRIAYCLCLWVKRWIYW